MQLANTTTRYGAVPQILHWLTAIFVICGCYARPVRRRSAERQCASYRSLHSHDAWAKALFVLLIARLAWRVANPPPPPEPTPLGRLLVWTAKLSHFALYALAARGAVSGHHRAAQARPRSADFRSLAISHRPGRPIARSRESVLGIHDYLADALLILAGVHAVRALVHHYVWRDRTLRRMLPGAA